MAGVAPGRRRPWIKTFSDRYPWVGPTIWMLSIQYFLAQVVVAWVWNPPYSISKNTISDLGNTACGTYAGSYVCSPRHGWMNASFIALGFVMAAGSWLIYQEFTEREHRERVGALIGFTCLAIAGVGTFFVGKFPENTVRIMHLIGAGLAIGVGNVGIFVLGLMLPLPRRMCAAMVVVSVVSIAALLLFASHRDLGLGPGGMERVAAYPETLWLIGIGLFMSKSHFSKRGTTAAVG